MGRICKKCETECNVQALTHHAHTHTPVRARVESPERSRARIPGTLALCRPYTRRDRTTHYPHIALQQRGHDYCELHVSLSPCFKHLRASVLNHCDMNIQLYTQRANHGVLKLLSRFHVSFPNGQWDGDKMQVLTGWEATSWKLLMSSGAVRPSGTFLPRWK